MTEPIPEPVRHSLSHEEAIMKAKEYLTDLYGAPKGLSDESRDLYFTNLGMLVDFIHTIHPPDIH